MQQKTMKFRLKLSSINVGSNKSDEQLSKIKNMKFYNAQKEALKFNSNYFKTVHKAAYNSKHGKGLKKLTPKQMLQKLPIALALLKAGNTPENLQNEIRQIIYSLYRTKGITKKVYNEFNKVKKQNGYYIYEI